MRFFRIFFVVVIVLNIFIVSLLCIQEQRLSQAILQISTYSMSYFGREFD
jgi:hypothetical protein